MDPDTVLHAQALTIYMETATYIVLAFQAIMTIAGFFAGLVIKDLGQAVKDLRSADERLAARMSNFVPKDDFRDFRDENRQLSNRLFDKLDAIQDQLSQKADRPSVNHINLPSGQSG